MPRLTKATQLTRLIHQLKAERAEHVQAIADIDSALGGSPDSGASAGRKRGPKPGGRRGKRKRGRFAVSGEQSVTDFVEKHGKPNAAEVNKHWQAEGRGGKADNALSKLVKQKKLKRVAAKGERGARYTVA